MMESAATGMFVSAEGTDVLNDNYEIDCNQTWINEWDQDHSLPTNYNSAIKVNLIIFVFDCICCVIGLPLNFYMAATILCKKRLRRKAKNILQLAPALCDIFTPICI